MVCIHNTRRSSDIISYGLSPKKPSLKMLANMRFPMANVFYFAYGSNISIDRFLDRIPTAILVGKSKLGNYKFTCNKRSIYGSAKGNISPLDGENVWGVVYEIIESDLSILDGYEIGYNRIDITVEMNGKGYNAVTYISDNLTNTLPTYQYLKHIIDGAIEIKLPDNYIDMLMAIPTQTHPGN